MCIVYNYLFMEFEIDRSQYFIKEDKFTVNYMEMEDIVNDQTRKIRRMDHDYIRVRQKDSERIRAIFDAGKRKGRFNVDKTSFEWLSENYIRKRGLRKWTWKVIFNGLRNEHLHWNKSHGDSEIDAKFVHIIWNMIVKFGGIVDIDKKPNLNDPDSEDVKLVLSMYSLDSFLYRRLNESSRLQQT